ncbi:CHASE2 domain-containing protein [Paenacidovorax monticola]|uniref:CHASE2 domain-containing protein n=1 Tax=Paenacidovorax monticola TaxID=1926868 RepID=UPI001FE4012A|nr:CHASE2 domain-containing protein [Paenacidovorax monticola]
MPTPPEKLPLRRLEWGALVAALLGLVLWLSGPGDLPRVNHLVQDTVSWLYPRPASPDVVIIAVDDRSISAIGRWPWRRALHAQMIGLVSKQAPRAIGMDILFSEEDLDYPGDDLLLARAMRSSGRVALPVIRRSQGSAQGTERPLSMFAQAAAQLGHVHVNMDGDGVVRSLYLQEGPASAPWPHLSLAMQCAAGVPHTECTREPAAQGSGGWVKQQPEIIAFASGTLPFTTYSYIDVLRGQVPQDAFKDKYVLVGATAAGLGDMLSAPPARWRAACPMSRWSRTS